MVKLPGRIVVKRSARYLGKADQGNSTAASSQLAQAFAPPLPTAVSLRSNSRLGFPGEPPSYKLNAASARDHFYALARVDDRRVDDHGRPGQGKSRMAAVIAVQEASH